MPAVGAAADQKTAVSSAANGSYPGICPRVQPCCLIEPDHWARVGFLRVAVSKFLKGPGHWAFLRDYRLAKLDALIAAIGKESGILEKAFS
jgi:hypothetical protein